MNSIVALKLSVSVSLLITLGGCSTITPSKEVTWLEEVLLNSGETITVTRTASYELGSAAYNPLQQSWNQKANKDVFEWRGQRYSFSGRNAMVIAVSPANELVILRPFLNEEITSSRLCRKPSYKQFQFVGGEWVSSDRVDSWALQLPRNLLFSYGLNTPATVSNQARQKLDGGDAFLISTSGYRIIDPEYVDLNCKGAV